MNILALLSGNPAAAATAPAFNSQMSPEANAFIGARPTAPKVESFQRPKGLRNTIGEIADALAVMGGQTPGYSTALKNQEATFVKKQKENALADYLNNPNDPAAMQRFQTVAPVEALEVITKLTPKPQSTGSLPREVVIAQMLADPAVSPEVKAQLQRLTLAEKPVYRTTPGGGTALIAPGGAVETIIPGREPAAPAAAAGPAPSAFERRAEAIRQTMGDAAYAEFLATGKVTAAATDPAKGGALGSTIGDIRKLYQDLNRVGGMVDPKAGVVSNLRARAANSGPGQLVAGALGTEAQTIRDQLASALPALMQQVKQATGMTAAQVNSIPEMRLLQDQVTNPTRSYPAVAATLDAIEKRYLGGGKPAAPATGGFKVVGKRKQ